MLTEFDFHYAMENTQVLHEPDRRIDTFGSTRFEFQLISELMDQANVTRVREGRIDAQKPLILKPEGYENWDFEGFGEQGRAFGEWFKDHLKDVAVVRYGFLLTRSGITEQLVHEPLAAVSARILETTRSSGNPMRAVIQGVDDTWEISLLKFTLEMIQKSQQINLFDFKRRGLIG
jgi:hypothetical protein